MPRKAKTAQAEEAEEKKPQKSPTLAKVDPSRRPLPEVVCATCPSSRWFATPTDLQCYCKQMYVITWSTTKPGQITICDGQTLGQEE